MEAVYREHRPSPPLAELVECYWTVRARVAPGAAHLNRVLPDGCMDVIFNLGDEPLREGCAHHRLRAYVVGAMRRPAPVKLVGTIDVLGVRFRPGGAVRFLPLAAHELTDQVADLGTLWRPGEDLPSALAEARGDAERVRVLERALLRRLVDGGARDRAVARVSEMIAASRGSVSVGELHRAVGMTRRHLERIFAEAVGLTPKTACRVARFRHALALAPDAPRLGWSRVALECGYYDQAHLIRDFRELAGVTPAAYLAGRADVASVQSPGAAAA